MEWYRVVLDEGNSGTSYQNTSIANSPLAHIIRRQVTTFFKAVTDLKARSRWCLTGTPIQNRLDDIGSLFAFIRASPFHNIAMFRRFVSTPFDESLERREVATKNLTLLLESLCLRRGRELLHLPDPKSRIRTIEFSADEREQYEQTKKIMNRALRQKVGESYSKSIFGMFQVQLQLRILCNHGTYQHPFSWAKRSLQDEREDALNSVEYGEINCSACWQSLPVLGSNNLYRTYRGSCAHVVCRECLDENQQVGGVTLDLDKNCPLCTISGVRTSIARPHAEIQEQNDSYLRREGYSSKMMALISDVKEDLDQTKRHVGF
jgi:SWI/SNF-related matrix-associated actin-dependent regulator of chromatin subfamily A3